MQAGLLISLQALLDACSIGQIITTADAMLLGHIPDIISSSVEHDVQVPVLQAPRLLQRCLVGAREGY
jgi:hypothetical protein